MMEFSGVVLNRFRLSRSTVFTEISPMKLEELAQTIVRGNMLFNVKGQECGELDTRLLTVQRVTSVFLTLFRNRGDNSFTSH